MDKKLIFVLPLFIALFALLLLAIINSYQENEECINKGGEIVKTSRGYECAKVKKL